MANSPDYKCSTCEAPTPRDDLTVMKVTFLEMGAGGKTIRSRVAGWLCPTCLVKEPHWNREAFTAPGNLAPVMRPVRG